MAQQTNPYINVTMYSDKFIQATVGDLNRYMDLHLTEDGLCVRLCSQDSSKDYSQTLDFNELFNVVSAAVELKRRTKVKIRPFTQTELEFEPMSPMERQHSNLLPEKKRFTMKKKPK